MLLNIAGSAVIRGPSDAEVAAGDTADVATTLTAKLSFAELKRGKMPSVAVASDANAMWECDTADKCLNPTGLGQWDFPGTDAWVKERLTTIADHMRDPATAGSPHDAADTAADLPTQQLGPGLGWPAAVHRDRSGAAGDTGARDATRVRVVGSGADARHRLLIALETSPRAQIVDDMSIAARLGDQF